MWIICFISGWLLSCVFFCFTGQWECLLTKCNRVWGWANAPQTRAALTTNWTMPWIGVIKSLLTLMTQHWRQSNKYSGAMHTPCLLLKFIYKLYWSSREQRRYPIIAHRIRFNLVGRSAMRSHLYTQCPSIHLHYMCMFLNVCTSLLNIIIWVY